MTFSGTGGAFSQNVTVTSRLLLLGAGPSMVTFRGDFEFAAGAALAVRLAGVNAYDRLVVVGNVTLNEAALYLDVAGPIGEGGRYAFVQNFGTVQTAGTFRNAPDGTVVGDDGELFQIRYNVGDGNDTELGQL